MREEDGGASGDEGEDDEGAWEGWDVESDSSEDSSEGWIDVDSDSDEDIEVSDSEDEDGKKSKKGKGKGKGKGKVESEDEDARSGDDDNKEETAEEAVQRISTLATTKVCRKSTFVQVALAPDPLASDPYARRLRTTQRPPHQSRGRGR